MDHFAHIDEALKAVADAQRLIRRGTTKQVRRGEERDHMKTVSILWFKTIRPQIEDKCDPTLLNNVDAPIRNIFDSTAKEAARSTYKNSLNEVRTALLALRNAMPAVIDTPVEIYADDSPPDFSPLANDPQMREVMARRWKECVLCLDGDAPLAAVIMMGGLVESLFVSKANRLHDKRVLTTAQRAPTRNGKAKPFQEWTLNDYLEVGHELEWIGDSAKKVSAVLRDYRNFVHPQAELRQQTTVTGQDARLLWNVSKELARQLLSGP